jgi:hypothetical protein
MAPPNNVQLAQKEGRIALAVEAFKNGCFASKRACANAYDIPESTLRRRVKGGNARCDSVPINRKLTQTEETTLVKWILSMDHRGLAPTSDIVRQMANILLQNRSQNQPNPPTVGKLWVHNLVQRHKDLKSRYNRKYDYQRAKCEDPDLIRAWFKLVQNTIAKYGILDADIYNFDETGFQMGVASTAKVITGAERSRRPVSVQPGNRNWVTAIDCICADGQSLPPVIIFEGKLHQSTWYDAEVVPLPGDWVIGVSENGWTNDILGLTWLKNVFEKHTAYRTKGVYRLLILDGHGSHLTPEFDLFCTDHKIIALCMPPHSSHLLQPCDVSLFAVLKRLYGQQIQGYVRKGVTHIDKQDFLQAYFTARTEAATIANIQSGFAATGLVPHNPERVLSKLSTQLKTPTPPSSSHAQVPQSWHFKTPHDTTQLELQARAIQNNAALPTPENQALKQLVKGCQLAMQNAVLLAEENRQLRSENTRQKRKRAKKRAFIATGDILTVQEGRDLSQNTTIMPESGAAHQEESRQPRAQRKCSMCKSVEHTARTCPLRQASN